MFNSSTQAGYKRFIFIIYPLHLSFIANGLKDRLLARSIDDSNMVYIIFIITDIDKAKARFNSPELKKIMTDAGVISKPEAFMYKLVD